MMLFVPAFSGWFRFLYLLGGFTDTIDGTVARKLGMAIEFGAKFDTLADFVFASAAFIKLLPAIQLPEWVLIWTGSLLLLKILNIALGFLKHHRFVPIHSVLNKCCGAVVFFTPLFLGAGIPECFSELLLFLVCMFASAGALQEAHYIWTGNQGCL